MLQDRIEPVRRYFGVAPREGQLAVDLGDAQARAPFLLQQIGKVETGIRITGEAQPNGVATGPVLRPSNLLRNHVDAASRKIARHMRVVRCKIVALCAVIRKADPAAK